MNMQLIAHLVKKDWDLNQGPMIAYLVLGVIALWLTITDFQYSFAIGSIMLIGVVVTIGIHMVIATVTNDRKNQTLTFMMSLPISYREYTVAKMVANIGVAAGTWIFLYGILTALIFFLEPIPDGMHPFATLTMLYLLMIFFILLTTSMLFESEAVTIVVMTVMNISISLFMMWMGNNEQIGHLIEGPVAQWTPDAVNTLIGLIAVMVISTAVTFVLQSRKRNFIN